MYVGTEGRRLKEVSRLSDRVVLYNPRGVFHTMPLGVMAVGSALDRSRFEVVVVDGRLEEDPIDAVGEAAENALCLGVGVLTGAPIRDALAVSRAVKARHPDILVVWGGWHPSPLTGSEANRPRGAPTSTRTTSPAPVSLPS